MAYKVFTNGSVLNASEINDNLMNQSVMVFSNSTARAAAIATPLEGMLTWLQDTNQYENYNGSAWVALITPSASGLTLLASQTFTATTSVIIDNVFSTTYDAYQIVANATSSSPTSIEVNYRVGGVNASTGYSYSGVGNDLGAIFRTQGSNVSTARIGRWDSSGGLAEATIRGVALAARTYGVSQSIDSITSTEAGGHFHTTATAYDGIRFTFQSSTGEIKIYGLEK